MILRDEVVWNLIFKNLPSLGWREITSPVSFAPHLRPTAWRQWIWHRAAAHKQRPSTRSDAPNWGTDFWQFGCLVVGIWKSTTLDQLARSSACRSESWQSQAGDSIKFKERVNAFIWSRSRFHLGGNEDEWRKWFDYEFWIGFFEVGRLESLVLVASNSKESQLTCDIVKWITFRMNEVWTVSKSICSVFGHRRPIERLARSSGFRWPIY